MPTASSSKAQQQQQQTAAPPKKQVHHGKAFEEWWSKNIADPLPQPKIVCASDDVEARPGYMSKSATEYNDLPQVLDHKVDFLISMMKNSKKGVAYIGAGLSSSVLCDYASRASGSTVRRTEASGNRKLIPPQYQHRVLASLFKAKYLSHLLDQNHDCLVLKAGLDPEKICLIHGHWFDQNNRVLAFDDKLRPDLLDQMMGWARDADFCFAIGTSLAGMTADCVAESVARRFVDGPHETQDDPQHTDRGQGLAILTIQETRMDSHSALKIYAPIQKVMEALEKKLKLKIDPKNYDVPRFPPPPRRTSLAAGGRK